MNKIILPLLTLFFNVSSFAQEGGDCINPDQIDPGVICGLIYAPVCGCDNVTYSNSCIAEYVGGVTSWTDGECSGMPECMDVGEIDFGLCEMYLGIAMINGSCTSVSGCDYVVDDVDYSAYFYENLEDCAACHDQCEDPNAANEEVFCLDVIEPVCGCDNVTYSNSCVAYYFNGITSWTPGECGTASEGDCQDLGGIDFGPCDAIIGVAVVNGSCVDVSGCSQTDTDGTDWSGSFFSSMNACLTNCADSLCYNPDLIDLKVLCSDEEAFVCGCDSVTYLNACVAEYMNGISSWTEGPCVADNIKENVISPFSVFPNPTEDVLTIQLNTNMVYDLKLMDQTGRVVYTYANQTSTLTLDVTQLESGIYYVTILGEDGMQEVQKVMIK